MKFTIEKHKLNDLIKQINSIVNDNALNAMYTLLLVKTNSSNNEVNFTFANEKVAMQKTITNVLINDDFSFCLKAKLFTGIVAKLNSGEINFEKIDSVLNISTSNFDANINLVDMLLFPELIFDEYKVYNNILNVDNQLLSKIYRYTAPTVAQQSEETSKLILCGLHFKTKGELVGVVSTDSFRASSFTFANAQNNEFEFIIEPNILKQVIDSAGNHEISLYLSSKNFLLFFVWENNIMSVKLSLAGNYPNIDNHFIKENDSKFTIKNKDLLEMAEHGLSLVQNEKTPIAKISIDNEKVEMRYQSIDFGSSYESTKWITFNGVNIIFSVNTKYLLSILKIYDPEDVLSISLSEHNPIIIKKEDYDELKHLVLPTRSY